MQRTTASVLHRGPGDANVMGGVAAQQPDVEASPTNSVSSSASHAITPTAGRQALTDAEKLRKVLTELIETERAYVSVRLINTMSIQ